MDLFNFVRFTFRTELCLPSGKKLPGRLSATAALRTEGRLRVIFLTTQGEKLCPFWTPSSVGL
jgi:hypothetical protein